MDTNEAEEILDGGETNALSQPGTLVSDPSFVVEISKDGTTHSMNYGKLGRIDENSLDYLVHRVYDVTLADKLDAYEGHEFIATIFYYSEDDEVVSVKWVATPDGWEEL